MEKVIYVDKDRAAAVIIGENKDLKSAMKGKRRRDRNAADANVSFSLYSIDFIGQSLISIWRKKRFLTISL